MDDRQACITYQNQSHLAFEILKFNAATGEGVDPTKVVELALRLTRIGLNVLGEIEKQQKRDKEEKSK
jgi:hypothetical protein